MKIWQAVKRQSTWMSFRDERIAEFIISFRLYFRVVLIQTFLRRYSITSSIYLIYRGAFSMKKDLCFNFANFLSFKTVPILSLFLIFLLRFLVLFLKNSLFNNFYYLGFTFDIFINFLLANSLFFCK